MAAESFHADGRTDRHDEAVAFHNLANAPNKTLRYAPSGVALLSARFISQDPLLFGFRFARTAGIPHV